MQKIEVLNPDSLPPNFMSRIYGGSTPKYFHVRFVGKSPALLRPEITMEYMIANEFICYNLANLVTGINIPEYFMDLYEGKPYFFTRDIDPRPDTEIGIFELSIEQLTALDSDEVHLASAFNVWVLNRDASDGRNTVIVDGKLYLIDFGNALFGTKKGKWNDTFGYYKDNKEHSQTILYPWFNLSPDKFKVASEIISLIPDNAVGSVLKKAQHLGLIGEGERASAYEFLIDRKLKLREMAS